MVNWHWQLIQKLKQCFFLDCEWENWNRFFDWFRLAHESWNSQQPAPSHALQELVSGKHSTWSCQGQACDSHGGWCAAGMCPTLAPLYQENRPQHLQLCRVSPVDFYSAMCKGWISTPAGVGFPATLPFDGGQIWLPWIPWWHLESDVLWSAVGGTMPCIESWPSVPHACHWNSWTWRSRCQSESQEILWLYLIKRKLSWETPDVLTFHANLDSNLPCPVFGL